MRAERRDVSSAQDVAASAQAIPGHRGFRIGGRASAIAQQKTRQELRDRQEVIDAMVAGRYILE